MKKHLKWVALAASIVTALFTSCSSGLDNATITGPGYGEKNVTLYASSNSDIILFTEKGPQRTILPDTIDGTSDAYIFYLWGEDKLGVVSSETSTKLATPYKVDFTPETGSTTKGSVNLDLEVSQYELYLAVLSEEKTAPTTGNAAKDNAILFASTVVDFRSSDSVNFFLSPYKLSATGGFALEIYAEGGWEVPATHTVKVGIYDVNTGTKVAGTVEKTSISTEEASKFTFKTAQTDASEVTPNYKSESETSVKPGTYNFIFELVPTPASGLKKHFYYSDKIVILSNQETRKAIAIPDILTTKPNDPEELGVSFINPLTADTDDYEVQFTWKDKSYNEEYFQLELLDFTNLSSDNTTALADSITALSGGTGAKADALDEAWSNIRGSTYTANEILYTFNKKYSVTTGSATSAEDKGYFYGNSEFWVDGSMNPNSTYAVLRLKLGHRYFARLCAVNDVGNSSYLYADITGTTVTDGINYHRYGVESTENTVDASALKKFGPSVEINRFRITYNLNEGTFWEQDADDKTKRKNEKLTIKDINKDGNAVVKYGTHKLADTADVSTILNPLNAPDTTATPKYAILFDGDFNKWTNWLVGSVTGSIYTLSKDYSTDGNKETPTFTEAKYTDFKNLDLYATYRITSGAAKIDESANYNIKKDMVKVFSSTTFNATTLPASPTAATPVKGVYQFVNSSTADANNVGITPAKTIFVALVNDAANNYINGTPVSYDKVVMQVLRNGNSAKQTTTSTQKATIAYSGKTVDGDSTEASANYVAIPIGAYAAGKYAVQIHAYANTQQGEYTYTIYFEVRDPSATPAVTPTFTAQTKTFALSDLADVGDLGTEITAATSGTTGVLTASVTDGTVTVTSVAKGTSVVTLGDGTNTKDYTFTVSASGAISVSGITLH